MKKLTKPLKDFIVIIDTSALLKNANVIDVALDCFKKVVIPSVCIDELSRLKDKQRREKKGNSAWLTLIKINNLKTSSSKLEIYNFREKDCRNDDQIIKVAKLYKEKDLDGSDLLPFILTDDVDFSVKYEKVLKVNEFINNYQFDESTASKNAFATIAFNKLQRASWDGFSLPENVNLRYVFSDGSTLLINAINRKDYGKIKFLIENGVDLNQNDVSKYFLTPLAHCVQKGDVNSLKMLLDAGADYNKGSINETVVSHIKLNNEGNTPLMIACWHGYEEIVKILCAQPKICLNQQDSNGYTALIKAAIKKHKVIYDYLLSQNKIDPLIRDRKNHDAEWHMNNSETI